MHLSTDVALFALTNATDPELAASSADLAGVAVLEQDVHPTVSFPGHWVLKRSRGPAALAAYAVQHCTDSATLTAVAKRETRKVVRKALAANPYLTNEGADLVGARCDPNSYVDEIQRILDTRPMRASDNVPEVLDTLLALAALDPETTWARTNRRVVLGALACDAVTPVQVDAVIDQVTGAGYDWILADVLAVSYQHPTQRTRETRGLLKASRTVSEHLALLPSAEPSLLLELVIHAMGSAGTSPRGTLLDAELATRMVAAIPAEHTPKGYNATWKLLSVFTADAIDVLADSPRWAPFIWHHEMTDQQYARVLSHLDPAKAVHMFQCTPTNRVKLALLLDQVEQLEECPVAVFSIEGAMGTIDSNRDPLLQRLLAVSTPSMKMRYLGGMWASKGQTFTPPMDQVPALVDDIRAEAASGTRLGLYGHVWAHNPEYIHLLVDLVPGFARANLDRDVVTAYAYAKLTATGAPMDLALSQLDTCTAVGLTELCAALSRMASLHGTAAA